MRRKPGTARTGGRFSTSPATLATRRISANLTAVVQFLTEGRYLAWPHDPYIRPTGDVHRTAAGDTVDGTTHHRVRVYYSPSVVTWLNSGRSGELPDRSMIVKEMYRTIAPFYPTKDEVIGWAAMVKKAGASHDGWFWAIYFKPEFRSMDTMGTFNYSFCLTCHASAISQNTFVDLDNLTGRNAANTTGRSFVGVVDPIFFRNDKDAPDPPAAGTIDPNFVALYSQPSIYPYTPVPAYRPETAGKAFPSTDFDHVWNPSSLAKDAPGYITSDNCIGCHDATMLVDTKVPNMLIRRPADSGESEALLNLSVYGEWRSSPMGMAGRDPVFFAQLEAELTMHPEVDNSIEDVCLSCHGVMGQRQFHLEQGAEENFSLAPVFETAGQNARYGALSRDGISCVVCHQMSPETFPDVSGQPLPDTGAFLQGASGVIHGPTSPDQDPGGLIRPLPMEHALGVTPTFEPHIGKSELCGTCHTVRLPVLVGDEKFQGITPVSGDGQILLSEAHEQDTYLEWLYSAYQNLNPDYPVDPATARSCQDCHMSSTFMGNANPIAAGLANIEDTSWPIPPASNLAPAEAITVPIREKSEAAHLLRHESVRADDVRPVCRGDLRHRGRFRTRPPAPSTPLNSPSRSARTRSATRPRKSRFSKSPGPTTAIWRRGFA